MATVGVRDPRDLRTLSWYVLLLVVAVLLRLAPGTTAGLESDIANLVSKLPTGLVGIVIVAIQVAYTILFLGIPIFLLLTRRWRRWAIYTLGFLVTSVCSLLVQHYLPTPAATLDSSGGTGTAGSAWPSSVSVATSLTALILVAPYLNRAWRRFGWAFIAVLALLRVVAASDLFIDLIFAIGIGGSVGTLLLLVFGRQIPAATSEAIIQALARVDISAESAEIARTGPTGPDTFDVTTTTGERLHCKVVSSGQVQAANLFRSYRRARMRQIGEDASFSSTRRAASVEAMVAMSAARAGVRTPEVAAVAALSADDMLIVFEQVPGTPLSHIPAAEITDEVLSQAWRALARLRRTGLAHRDLQLSSWLLSDGQLWLIDYSFGEPAASAGALNSDIAELLAATSAVVGPERAVAAAANALPSQELTAGIGYLVPAALTSATRASLKQNSVALNDVVEVACQAVGIEEPEFAPIERIKPRTLVMIVLLVLAVYVLLPQLADLPQMIAAIRAADVALAGAAALASLVTYIGVALSIKGSVPAPIGFIKSLLAAFAATFVGAFSPPGVAHVGVTIRFIQKQGLPAPVAISASAAKEVAVAVVHVVLLVLLAVAAGSSGALSSELQKLPSAHTVAIGAAVVLALIIIVAAIPKFRRTLSQSVLPAVRHSVEAIRELLNSPGKMTELFLGAILLQLGYIASLYFAVHALGGDLTFVTIGLIYLTVGSVAAVAPTPGGVGAVEAVLLAALTGVGMAAAPALAAVFLYRLLTFWIPIPVGGLATRYLVSRDLL